MPIPLAVAAAATAETGAAASAAGAEGAIAGEMAGGSAGVSESYGSFMAADEAKATEESNVQLKEIVEQSKKMVGGLNKIADSVKGISPALDQQLVVLNKTIQLFLRPLLDAVARFIQPFIIALYKVVLDWYRIVTKFIPGAGGTDDPNKKLASLIEQRQFALEAGDTERVKRLDSQIEEAKLEVIEYNKYNKNLAENVKKVGWEILKIIYPAALLADVVLKVGQVLDAYGVAVDAARLKLAQYTNTGTTSVSYTSSSGQTYGTYTKNGQGYSGLITDDIKFMDTANAILAGQASKSTSNASSKSVGMTPAPSNVLLDAAYGLQSRASGGEISSSGYYNLHAGEMVLNAGEVAMMKKNSGGSFSFNNTFNIGGGLNSESDVRAMAKKLAEYQEVELRRRTSYM